MPIKFRCEHCQQLLGISRTRAGQIADCPTCGRSLRVPELDGRREPVPRPQLNMDDSRLAGALDELAQIGLEPAEPVALSPDETPQKAVIITPEPLPEPVPIEPPVTESPREPRHASPHAESKAEPAPAATDDALAELARGTIGPAAADFSAPPFARRRWRTMISLPLIAMLIGAAALGFGLGYLAGRGTSAETASTAAGNGAAEAAGVGSSDNAAARPAIKGRITYKNEDGDSRPDRQARVLVFPQRRSGQRKLDVIGLRTNDAADDFRSAAAAFRALGGDVAVAKEDGSYEVALPAAGTYHILVLSNYQPRDRDEPVDGALLSLLSEYFDRPQQLLGRVAYRWGQVRYKGAEPELWDHSF